MNVNQYREKLLQILIDLIDNYGVTQFYSGYRGDFDVYCSHLIHELKGSYPQIRNSMVLSYIPEAKGDPDYDFTLPKCFDDSVYLLERSVPKRLAMYDDGLLVKGAEYSFVPEKFTDESVFEYSYSADGIVKVENGKLTALKTGDVTVTVSLLNRFSIHI